MTGKASGSSSRLWRKRLGTAANIGIHSAYGSHSPVRSSPCSHATTGLASTNPFIHSGSVFCHLRHVGFGWWPADSASDRKLRTLPQARGNLEQSWRCGGESPGPTAGSVKGTLGRLSRGVWSLGRPSPAFRGGSWGANVYRHSVAVVHRLATRTSFARALAFFEMSWPSLTAANRRYWFFAAPPSKP